MNYRDDLVVVDSSVVLSALLPGATAAPDDLLAGWVASGVEMAAPALWQYEVVSVLRRSVYAGHITTADAREMVEDVRALGVRLYGDDLSEAALEWAERLGQSRAYDAFYVALAERLGAVLWTADRRLANGAGAAGAPWVRWTGGPETN